MPAINSHRTTAAASTHRIDRNVLQESLDLYHQVQDRLSENKFDEALQLTHGILHPNYKSLAIHALFPQIVVKRPHEAVALIAQIQDPEIQLNCQTFACYRLNQLGLRHLVQQVSQESIYPEIKRLTARLLR